MDPAAFIQDALARELVVEFSYTGKMRTFSPFTAYDESALGWDHGRDEVRRYRYDKMANVRVSPDEEYVLPQ